MTIYLNDYLSKRLSESALESTDNTTIYKPVLIQSSLA